MKKFLQVFLIISLLVGVVSMVSCDCDEEIELPYGVVLSVDAVEENIWKNYYNEIWDKGDTAPPHEFINNQYGYAMAVWYKSVNLEVNVKNTGTYGILTFHASTNYKTLFSVRNDTGYTQDSMNITLDENEEGVITFHFWVDRYDLTKFNEIEDLFEVQAVNLQDVVGE